MKKIVAILVAVGLLAGAVFFIGRSGVGTAELSLTLVGFQTNGAARFVVSNHSARTIAYVGPEGSRRRGSHFLELKPDSYREELIWPPKQKTEWREALFYRRQERFTDKLRSWLRKASSNVVCSDYRYVPGLQADDPLDLVLFYFNRPTPWRLHVQRPPTIWSPKMWIVVPVDAFTGGDGRGYGLESRGIGRSRNQVVAFGEQSQSLTTEQFTNRLIATLNFLRTKNRPHWEAVVKEHTAFLNSLPEKP